MIKKMRIFLCLLAVFITSVSFAEPIESDIYKGTLGTHNITIYIGKGEGCGGDDYFYSGMYSYDNGKNWLLLTVTRNKGGFFCMVENAFTGALLLTQSGNSLNGNWYSPDQKKVMEVKVTKEKTSAKKLKEFFDAWDKLNYEKNDC